MARFHKGHSAQTRIAAVVQSRTGHTFFALLLLHWTVLFSQSVDAASARGSKGLPPILINLSEPPKVPKTLDELLSLPPQEIDRLDIGVINLLCAEGLPGAEDLNVQKSLETLDSWARLVEIETKRHAYRFESNPELFAHSPGYFRMQMLADVLVNDLRVRYHPDRSQESRRGLKSRAEQDHFFADSRDIFLPGLLDKNSRNRLGTCASMPFLYVAIARRLGYPVHLAASEEHLYLRYEEENGQHLNVEATSVSRFKTPPDEFYRANCEPSRTDEDVRQAGWHRPLSTAEVLGHALFTRIACLRAAKLHEEELKTWDIASRYLPQSDLWRKAIEKGKGEAIIDHHTARWDALWDEVSRLPLPRGNAFAHFREQKIRLHLFMNNSTNLAEIKARLKALRLGLGEFLKPAMEGQSVASLVDSDPAKKDPVSVFHFGEKEIPVPENQIPMPMRGGRIPPPLVQAIYERGLDRHEAILNFIWDQREEAVLRADQRERARIAALIANPRPKPVLLPKEQVPVEFWNGFPPDLEKRLQAMINEDIDHPSLLLFEIGKYHRQGIPGIATVQEEASVFATVSRKTSPGSGRRMGNSPAWEAFHRKRARSLFRGGRFSWFPRICLMLALGRHRRLPRFPPTSSFPNSAEQLFKIFNCHENTETALPGCSDDAFCTGRFASQRVR